MALSTARNAAGDSKNVSYRLAVLGGGGVGKSSLIHRWVLQEFSDEHKPTVEDRHQHNFLCGQSDVYYRLLIIDTGGDQQFPAMQQLYMKDAQAFFLVISVTNKQSLEEATQLRNKIMVAKGGQEQAPIVVIANKVDIPIDQWEISQKDMDELSTKWNCPLVQASAKNNVHVDEMFGTMLSTCREYFGCPADQGASNSKKRSKCTIL
jgi:small GTP-binding protein